MGNEMLFSMGRIGSGRNFSTGPTDGPRRPMPAAITTTDGIPTGVSLDADPIIPTSGFFGVVDNIGISIRNSVRRQLGPYSIAGHVDLNNRRSLEPRVEMGVEIKSNMDLVITRRVYEDKFGKSERYTDRIELTPTERDPDTKTFSRVKIDRTGPEEEGSCDLSREDLDPVRDKDDIEFAEGALKDAKKDLIALLAHS